MPERVVYIYEEPDPYRIPFFERVSRRDDIEQTVFYCGEAGKNRGGEIDLGDTESFSHILPGFRIRLPFLTPLKVNPSIDIRLSNGGFDRVILGGFYHPTMLYSILWCRIHGVPYIINCESHFLNRRGWFKSLLKKVFYPFIVKNASAYLATGKFSSEYLIYYGADFKNIFYFPNTPDIEFFSENSKLSGDEKKKFKEDLGVSGRYVIIFVGRMVEEKGVDTLIEAFRMVREKFSDVSLVLIGEGPLKEKYQDYVSSRKIPDVHFTGFVQNRELPRYYGMADIFVLPSRMEPWGVSVNEAMASGLPVILSDKVGSRGSLLKGGENGFMFKSEDYKELAKKIEKLLHNPEMMREMGKNSRSIVKKYDYSYCEQNLEWALREARR